MVEIPDPYWFAAATAAQAALDEAEYVLVPDVFLPLSPRFVPLEFSWGLQDGGRLAWCCSKDDVDRLAPWTRDAATSDRHFTWANEVFVLGANFEWSRIDAARLRKHLPSWHKRVARYRKGIPLRPSRERAFVAAGQLEGSRPPPEKRVLVIGASGMGNAGDDLLAEVIGTILNDAGAEVVLSGPDIDPLRVKDYDAIVVGGGGLVYASREGDNETQNLANYLKFGPISRQFGVPAALIGVGDQDHAGGIQRYQLSRAFAHDTLPHFHAITTRDAASATLLAELGAPVATSGSDLLFHWAARARAAVHPSGPVPARIALAGEFYRYPAFAAGLGDGEGPLAHSVGESDFEILVMSDDDRPHAKRLQAALRNAGATVSTIDLRGRSLDALIFLFSSYRGVVTTRFHGLVLAALAGVPVAALDGADGKKARLCRQLAIPGLLIGDDASAATQARLAAALGGQLDTIPSSVVDNLAAETAVHVTALRSLIGLGPDHSAASPSGAHVTTRPPPKSVQPAQLLDRAGRVGLCWAASSVNTDGFGNLGDSLSAVVVAALSGRPVRHVNFDEAIPKLVAVGSIGHAIRQGTALVWGAGVSIRGGILAQNAPSTRYDVRAIRGPISARHYRDFGIDVPEVYGDPVWLLPSIFHEPVAKKYELGIIPHIQDVAAPHPDSPPQADSLRYVVEKGDTNHITLINTWHEPTWEGLVAKLRQILACRRILSQSFHGLVIAEAYGIPALNFRHVPGIDNAGIVRIDLNTPCTVDPRVFEFFQGGTRTDFPLYAQRRDARSDWAAIIKAIDAAWEPFAYDAAALVDAFPLPLAYNPLRERLTTRTHLEKLRF